MKRNWVIGIGMLVAGWLTPAVWAADHADGPAAKADPSADITDVFAWMAPDANRVYLVMDLVRNATSASKFSDSVQYVFHTVSKPSFGGAASPEVDITCVFDAAQKIQCWAGSGVYVTGDASATDGIRSADGKLKVFAGLRDDPFFFNLAGFKATGAAVAHAASSLTFDAAGCPALDAATATTLVTQLQTAPGGGPAVDNFAHFNVLALVVSVDKSVLTAGGPILGVWGSTNRVGASSGCFGDRNGDGEVKIDEIIVAVNNALHGCQNPSSPPLSNMQIDRMGRAGVNTALTNPFFDETDPTQEAAHEAAQDEYNGATNPAEWGTMFASEIATNLAILDGLDQNCGNQLLAGATPVAGRYNALAGVLADDQLYVNTASGTCSQYLAVEANAVGITNNDCGGRTPLEDTIDTTYSLLAAGALSGVTDGIAIDGDGVASLTTFPFLDHPN